jgi:hypothetical protein
MFEITIKVSNFTNTLSHAEAKIVDFKTGQSYIVDYSPVKYKGFSEDFKDDEDNILCCQPNVVKLYSTSRKTFEDFVKDYESEFKGKRVKTFMIGGVEHKMNCVRGKGFNIVRKNCADACNFALNYFFPLADNKKTEKVWRTYKAVTSPCCILTCGLLPFFGAPRNISAPIDILKKAQLLAYHYGKPPGKDEVVESETTLLKQLSV